eukprot:scaffold98700_cov36-Phaeocystis_antarctica.AAC.1
MHSHHAAAARRPPGKCSHSTRMALVSEAPSECSPSKCSPSKCSPSKCSPSKCTAEPQLGDHLVSST